MILTGPEIVRQVRRGGITVTPFDEALVGPNSLDVRLGPALLVFYPGVLDPRREAATSPLEVPAGGLVLEPHVGYLGSTVEAVGSDCFVPMLNGKSSLGRIFLQVHQTAGFGDVGFCAPWTLELMAMDSPVRVYPGMRIAQIAFFATYGAIKLYGGRYRQQAGPTPHRPEVS